MTNVCSVRSIAALVLAVSGSVACLCAGLASPPASASMRHVHASNYTVFHVTVPDQNAVREAEMYLESEAFSRSGLIKQLEFGGFTAAQAIYGVNHVRVNWDIEAAKDAKQYLQTEAFSRTALIQQLEFDGFTPTQAAYGAKAVGL